MKYLTPRQVFIMRECDGKQTVSVLLKAAMTSAMEQVGQSLSLNVATQELYKLRDAGLIERRKGGKLRTAVYLVTEQGRSALGVTSIRWRTLADLSATP